MRTSRDRAITGHVGSLPGPDGLIAAYRGHDAGEPIDGVALRQIPRASVAEVVRHQHEPGIDIPCDGEFGKPTAQSIQYGSWWRCSWQRPGGPEFSGPGSFDTESRRSLLGQASASSSRIPSLSSLESFRHSNAGDWPVVRILTRIRKAMTEGARGCGRADEPFPVEFNAWMRKDSFPNGL